MTPWQYIRSACTLLIVICPLFISSCSSEKNGTGISSLQDTQASAQKSTGFAETGQSVSLSPGIDGPEGKETAAPSGDIPPTIVKAVFAAERVNNSDTLKVIVQGKDAGAEVTYTYQWMKNAKPAGDGDSLTGFKRGDRISVRITPHSGGLRGQSILLSTEIWNIPPNVLDSKKLSFDGKSYIHQITATDSDGDILTYTLKSGPQDATINSTTGLFTWAVPQGFEGKVPVTVLVTDGHGGESLHSFTIETSVSKKQ